METKNLTIKQQQFCKHYIENKGNATRAYMKAFGVKNTETAKVNWSKLLTNANISNKINETMEEQGFNNVSIDFELWKVIQQDKNLYAKLRWIEIYNRIRNRYKLEQNNNDINLEDLSTKDLLDFIKK